METQVAKVGEQREPRGFAGAVRAFIEMQPRVGRVLRLPDEGLRDGGFLRLPQGPFDGAVVSGLPESLGRLDMFLRGLRATLVDGAPVAFDVVNAGSMHVLRFGLEAKRRNLEPLGMPGDADRPIHKRALLAALAEAGFVVHDVVAVPAIGEQLTDGLSAALLAQGVVPFALRHGLPPRRFWVRATAMPAVRGSVLIASAAGPDAESAIEATRARLSFLPQGWEIVPCSAESEAAAFDLGLSRCAGEVVWCLRAGSEFSAQTFTTLHQCAVGAAVVQPSHAGAAIAPGDISGIMAWRHELLALGPIGARFVAPQIAYEEFGLSVDAQFGAPASVEVEFATPLPPRRPGDASAEGKQLIDAWQKVGLDQDPRALARPRDVAPAPWAGRQPRISLCMMVKNEAATLARCLRSARDRVDELIVVDTGSTDETVAIAQSFGARVLTCPWTDDFSAPRNVGLAEATGDWVLILDADETLGAEQRDLLRELVRDPTISGYQLVLQNEFDRDVKSSGIAILRLFRNLPGLRFQNRIHEQVLPSLQAAAGPLGLRMASSTLVIHHDGYKDACIRSRNKNERNDRLFKLQIEDKPDDVYSLYKYGDFLRRLPERRADALTILERAWRALREHVPVTPGELPYAAEIAALLGLELSCVDRTEEARAVLDTALRDYMATPNLLYVAAGLANQTGRHHEAIAHYRACMGFADQVMTVPVQEGVTSYIALAGMGQAYLRLGERERARELFAAAHALKPTLEVNTLAMSNLHLQEGRVGDALQVLTEHLRQEPEAAGVCQQAAYILARTGCTDEARSMGQRAVRLLERAELRNDAVRMRQFVAALDDRTRTYG